jgi:hypothetical protein
MLAKSVEIMYETQTIGHNPFCSLRKTMIIQLCIYHTGCIGTAQVGDAGSLTQLIDGIEHVISPGGAEEALPERRDGRGKDKDKVKIRPLLLKGNGAAVRAGGRCDHGAAVAVYELA